MKEKLNEKKTLNVFLCGTGTVGGTLLAQIAGEREKILRNRNLEINVVGIADIFNIVSDSKGISLKNFTMEGFREEFAKAEKSSLDIIRERVLAMELDDMVFVDCTASYEVAAMYYDFLDAGISIVCANKVAASGDYKNYRLLKETAHKRGVKYQFETNVGAGLPVINTINALVTTGDKIEKIEAVLSGTLNYIFNTISKDIPFSKTVQLAKENRFSEPDPRIDLSGVDVLRKLVILARESGYEMSQEDVEKNLFVPDEYFEGSLEEFWEKLPALDAHFEELRQEVEAAGQRLRFVAKLENGKGSISLQRVGQESPLYNLEGSNNIVMLGTARYNPHPMVIQGYGAGAAVTAAGVFADILAIANA